MDFESTQRTRTFVSADHCGFQSVVCRLQSLSQSHFHSRHCPSLNFEFHFVFTFLPDFNFCPFSCFSSLLLADSAMASTCIASCSTSVLANASLSSSFKSARPSKHVQSAFLGHAVSIRPVQRISSRREAVISAALKKAVAVLKGESKVSGTVTLTQEDDG